MRILQLNLQSSARRPRTSSTSQTIGEAGAAHLTWTSCASSTGILTHRQQHMVTDANSSAAIWVSWRRDGAGAPEEEGEPILHLGPSQWSLYIQRLRAPPRLNDAEFSATPLVDMSPRGRGQGQRPLWWQAI
ncbi:unnamed protein product [Trichogramma brassicae]|uniref:Uncharacterized protein n=1 Tax=Trichogramma brassicae TaxID=86971 RepID=A0A6H5J0Q3_9HYME|nr:unnamed protein product [Trichogramma brassicae]